MNAVLLDEGLSKGFSTGTFNFTGSVDSSPTPKFPKKTNKKLIKNKIKQNVENPETSENNSCTIVDPHVAPLSPPSISNSFIYSSSSLPDDKPKPANIKNGRKGCPRRSLKDLPIPHTTPWVVRHLREDKLEEALTVLRIWSPSNRRAELDEALVQTINSLDEQEALLAVRSLKEP